MDALLAASSQAGTCHCSYSIVFRLFHASSSLILLHRRFLLIRKVLKQTLGKLNETSGVDIGESDLKRKTEWIQACF